MKNLNTIIILLVLALAIQSCSEGTNKEDAMHEGEHGHDHEETHPDDVHLVQNQMTSMNIQLGTMENLALESSIKSSGQLELPPQNKASVSSLIPGRVARIEVLSGDKVRKGQVIAYLENPDFIDMQQKLISQKSELQFLEADFKRKTALVKEKISSRKEYERAKAKFETAQANYLANEQKLGLLHINTDRILAGKIYTMIPIQSPIGGYVRKVEVNIGKYVLPENELFEIVDNDHIHIDLRVYEKDIHRVKVGQKIKFSLQTKPNQIFEGEIFALGKAFEPEQKAMMVHAEISNKSDEILPGMYVNALIITEAEETKVLPNDAIVSDGGLNYVFALKPIKEKGHEDEFVFRKIEVNLGASENERTAVVPVYQLPDDTKYVVSGAFYLLAEMKKGEGGHGHHH